MATPKLGCLPRSDIPGSDSRSLINSPTPRQVKAGARNPPRLRNSILLYAAGLSLFSPAVALAESPGVAFLDGESRAFDPLFGTQRIPILNGGLEHETLTLLILDPEGPDGAPLFALVTPIAVDGAVATAAVASGEVWAPELAFDPKAPPGAYSARLVAYSTDGSHAAMKATLSIAGPTSTPRPGSLSEPFPDPIALYAEHTGLGWLGIGGLTSPATVELAAQDLDRLVVGPLLDELGRKAVPGFDRMTGQLVFAEVPGAGAYKGNLGRASESGEAPSRLVAVSLTVRDVLLFPLLVLLAGLWLAFRVDYWFTRRGPRLALEARLLEMREKSRERTEDDRKALNDLKVWIGRDRLPISLRRTGEHPVDLLAEASSVALKDFDATPSAEKREERWGAQGSEFGKVAAIYYAQIGASEVAFRSNEVYQALAGLFGESRADDFARSKIALGARDALGGGEYTSKASLDSKAAQRSGIAELIDKTKGVAEILERLEKLAEGLPAQHAEARLLMDKVSADPIGDLAQLQAHLDAARKLFDLIIKDRTRAGGATDAEGVATGETETDVEWIRRLFEMQEAVDTGGGGLDEGAYDLSPSSEVARAKLGQGNWLFSAAVTVIVVVSGLGTQYLANAKFGSPADYASLFVWGFSATALAQLFKYASEAFSSRALSPRPGAGTVEF